MSSKSKLALDGHCLAEHPLQHAADIAVVQGDMRL